MDFVSDSLYNGQKFRTLTVIDNFSKKCVAIQVGQSLKGKDIVNTLGQLHVLHGSKPQRIKVDNGSEFISKELDQRTYENKVTLDCPRPKRGTDQPFIESFNGSFRNECLKTNITVSLFSTLSTLIKRSCSNGFIYFSTDYIR